MTQQNDNTGNIDDSQHSNCCYEHILATRDVCSQYTYHRLFELAILPNIQIKLIFIKEKRAAHPSNTSSVMRW